MHSQIEPLVVEAQELSHRWFALVQRWSTSELPDSTPYARLCGATFQELSLRVISTLELVATLGSVDTAGQVMFLPKVNSAKQQLNAARTSVEQILTELNSNPDAKFKDTNNNLDNLQGFINDSHVVTVNAGTQLEQISNNMSALFDIVSIGLKFGKVKGLSLYQQYGRQLEKLSDLAGKTCSEIAKLHDTVEALRVKADEAAERASSGAEEAKAAADNSIAAADASHAAQVETEAKLAVIRETAKAAASLQTQVQDFDAAFDAFQKSLDKRVALHEKFELDTNAALQENQGREEEIDRLIKKSESMIKGSTTAGLGESLETTRKLYGRRMFGAGVGFFLSIVLLAASAIPLVSHVLPGLFTTWLLSPIAATELQNSNGKADAWISLLGKICLLFPATWLTQFFSKAFSEFFHLEREYAHKAALARSVEGFKKQAPNYEEEITTAVFFEVQSNPSKQKAPDAAEHPIAGPLMKKFIDALPFGRARDSDSRTAK
ncbi:hypothetical protein ACFOHU_12295 [Ottowia pentelensis]|uniref:Uncharacterized protein n=2 Tax=Ottowia pentelensis TaxID=511108 RepID=A0ABV6PVW8_9BURK